MGNQLGPEMDDAKQITADFVKSFVKNYTKFYTIGLMKECKKKLAKEAAGPKWKLTKFTRNVPPPNQKTGGVLKLSKYLKKWNQRYVVVKGNNLIEYFESEQKMNDGAKPLGHINMSNMNVHRDANDTILRRLEDLCKKAGLNLDDLPKPDKYPDWTIEIHHERKDAIYIQCADEADWKSWCDMFEKCRYFAPRYDVEEDKCHLWAFPIALWRTRWECDMWGWWWGGGGEISMIADAINEKIAWTVMGRVDGKLKMPWMARCKARNSFIKAIDGVVTSAVKPGWGAAYDVVKKVRPEVEAKLKDLLQPIVDAQLAVQKKIIELVEAGAKDTLNKDITPKLQPLLELIFAPVVDAFKLLLKSYDIAIQSGKEKYEKAEHRDHMVRRHNYNSEYWDAERKIWDLYDPLWNMRIVFEDIYPYGITGRARRRLRKTLDNALFTFETIFENDKESGKTWEQAAAEARDLMVKDCRSSIARVLGRILFGVVENFFEKTVIRVSRKLVAPLADAVPAAVKDFIDPEDMLEELLYNILKSCCAMVFEPFATRIEL